MLAGIVAGVIGLLAALAAVGVGIWASGLFENLGGRRANNLNALTRAELVKRLLALNQPDLPYALAIGKDTDLVLDWKIADAQWYGLLAKAGLKQTYHASIRVDEKRKAVRYFERMATVEWSTTGPRVTWQREFLRGRVLFQKSAGVGYGVRRDGTLGKVYKYNFDIGALRAPLKKTVEDAGWEFVPVLLRRHASYPA
jgi:hypothetical protein